MAEMTNKEIVEVLQSRGVDVNPNASKEVLLKQLHDSETIEADSTPKRDESVDLILNAIKGISNSLDNLSKRVTKIEDGGKNDFKEGARESDVKKAADSKKNVDSRIAAIVENTLGTDFGVEIEGYKDKPGLLFTILVPQRLSPIEVSTRPIKDETTGEYKVDEKKRLVEETYWPGDRRSRAIGSSESYDVIQDHCNRVRSNIVAYYEKMKMPLPEFRVK